MIIGRDALLENASLVEDLTFVLDHYIVVSFRSLYTFECRAFKCLLVIGYYPTESDEIKWSYQ